MINIPDIRREVTSIVYFMRQQVSFLVRQSDKTIWTSYNLFIKLYTIVRVGIFRWMSFLFIPESLSSLEEEERLILRLLLEDLPLVSLAL